MIAASARPRPLPVKSARLRRILVVEDNPDGREMLQTLLELWGFEVQVAEDGPTGVAQALAWRPDVAIVDIGLPGLSGYEVAVQLRARMSGRLLLIALTGFCQPQDRRKASDAGFDHYMTKPADLDMLSELLERDPVGS